MKGLIGILLMLVYNVIPTTKASGFLKFCKDFDAILVRVRSEQLSTESAKKSGVAS